MDLPVANGDMNNMDTPKGFSRLLKYKEMTLQKEKDKKEAKNNANVRFTTELGGHCVLMTVFNCRKKIFAFNLEKE